MKKRYLILLLCIVVFKGFSQTVAAVAPITPAKEWDVSMYGLIRTDYIWDTRKSAQVRELNLNLYPLDELKLASDENADQNAVGQSNFLSVVSRLGTKVKGPNVWGANINGILEGDFFGNTETSATSNSSIGMFRLRHAYITLDWAKTSVTVGQTWYPAFVPEVIPGTANFSTGILFNPFGWASQLKIKQNFTKTLSGSLTCYKEREFTTNAVAPAPSQNSASINSVLPTINAHFQFKNMNWIIGFQAEYKSIQPLTVSNGKMSTEKVNSNAVIGYAKYNTDLFSIKVYGISGTDLSSMVMIGGYAGYTTAANQPEQYKAIETTAAWIDIASNGKSVAPGLFIGYTKNNGTGKDGATAFYARGVTMGRSIDKVMRISGRVDFKQNKFRVSPEIEYTTATWGDQNILRNGTVDANQIKVGNIRTMITCVYVF
jgi:hypothetical protein